jgi:hypothetical protein
MEGGDLREFMESSLPGTPHKRIPRTLTRKLGQDMLKDLKRKLQPGNCFVLHFSDLFTNSSGTFRWYYSYGS